MPAVVPVPPASRMIRTCVVFLPCRETGHDQRHNVPCAGHPLPFACDALTHVELTHIEKRVENWIRFGQEAQEQILDRRRRVISFHPGSIFAFVCWAANEFGTVA